MTSPGEKHRPFRWLGGATGVVVAAYAAYAAAAWVRYGRSRPAAEGAPGDPLLDGFVPRPEVSERHEIRVRAPAEATLEAAKEVDLERSRANRWIFAVRSLPARLCGEAEARVTAPGLLAGSLERGWGVLAEVRGREIVLGSVTRPWARQVVFRPLPPAEFAAFDQPGYAKIVWSLAAEPLGPSESIARTETRVVTTDPRARARFRRYWAVLSPGILLVRRQALRLVKAEAERRARTAAPAPPGTDGARGPIPREAGVGSDGRPKGG